MLHSTRPLSVLAFFGVLLCAAPALAQDRADAAGACHSVSGEARFVAYGYNHVVQVTNTCDRALRCLVWTSVDTDPSELLVSPNSTGEAVVRVGSPARAFAAQGVCE